VNGKGDKRRPENKSAVDANWDRIFGNKDTLWVHECALNGKHMVESGKHCNWCGLNEQGEPEQ